MEYYITALEQKRIQYFLFVVLFCFLQAATTQAQSITFAAGTATSWTSKTNTLRVIISGDASGAVTGSIKLTFTPTSGSGVTTSVNLSSNSQDQSLLVHVKNLSLISVGGSSRFLYATPATATSLADGTYSVRASYQRVSGGATITSSVLSLTIDTSAFVPSFTSPASSGLYGSLVPIAYDINENYTAGTAKLVFSNLSGTTNTINLSNANLASTSFDINTAAVAASSSFITSATPNTIADGTYIVTLSYTESTSSSVTTSSKSLVTIDATPPILSLVSSVSSFTADATPSFSASTTEGGTLTYNGSCHGVTTSVPAGIFTISLASDGAGNPLSDGTYSNCTIQVTDAAGNSSAPLSVGTFTVDTVSPVLSEVTPVTSTTTDQSPDVTFTSSEQGTIAYYGACTGLSTAAQQGNNTITLLGSTIGYDLPLGTYTTCAIRVADAAGNVSGPLIFSSFSIVAPTSTPDATATPVATATSIPTPVQTSTPVATLPPQVANRTGRIVDQSGIGIPDVLVYIYQVGNLTSQIDIQAAQEGGGVGAIAVITDANGYYNFKGVPNGIYTAHPQTSGLVFEPSAISFDADSVPAVIKGVATNLNDEDCATQDYVSKLLSATSKSQALITFLRETVSARVKTAEKKLKGSKLNKLVAALDQAAVKATISFTEILQQSESLPTMTLACKNKPGCSTVKFNKENKNVRNGLRNLRRLSFFVVRKSREALQGKGAPGHLPTSKKISRLYTQAFHASHDLPAETDECSEAAQ